MRRRIHDPERGLFPFVWQGDDGPEEDDPPPDSPPLRECVRHRHDSRTVTLWEVPVRISEPPPGRA